MYNLMAINFTNQLRDLVNTVLLVEDKMLKNH